jgi:hypothetical protein
MSNATHEPRNPGDKKRRRNRGGRNRNQSRNPDQPDRQQPGGRQPGDTRQPGGNRQHGRQDTRPARKYSPPKLTWWQKLLKAVGLYKEPVQPQRPERAEESPQPTGGARREGREPKNNTRNVRSADESDSLTEDRPPRQRSPRGERSEREPRGDREPRGEREPRGDREPRGERPPRGERRGGDRNSVESPRVYVGNLSYDVSEEDLKDLFKGIGPVRSVEIVYNRSTHRSKGYGFVEMLHEDEAKRAVEVLHDQPFMGRNLTVSGAKSRGQDEREDQEDRAERDKPAVMPVLAPLPVAVAASKVEEVTHELTTIIEEVSAPAVDAVAEVHADSQTVQDELPLVPNDAPASCESDCGCSTTDAEEPAKTETP